jgi:mannose-1-phosphate guanylyltransferase
LAEESDKELVKRVQKGDQAAFDMLFSRYQVKILNLISRYVRDSDEVQDVAQEAFIKAYRALPRFRGESAFYTWLYRIAINTAKNHLVSRSRRPPSMDVDIEDADYRDDADVLRDHEDPESVMVVLPADHHVPRPRAFATAVRKAARAAQRAEVLVTLGVEPTRPETGYGYIRVGSAAGKGYPGLNRVDAFVEKPDLPTARRYLRKGGHLWNAGVFVWRAGTFLEEVASHAPELHRALAPLREKPAGRNRGQVESAYREAPSLPVDIAILEPSRRVWTLPVDFAWSDVGTWSSLADELGVGDCSGRGTVEAAGNRVIDGEVWVEDARSNLVWGQKGRVVALLAVENLAVVDTGDVILVTKLDRAADVKKFVAMLKARGRSDLI